MGLAAKSEGPHAPWRNLWLLILVGGSAVLIGRWISGMRYVGQVRARVRAEESRPSQRREGRRGTPMIPWRRLARRRWPRAGWIAGRGRYASVSFCRPAVTVMLYPTLEGAANEKVELDILGCGGRCIGWRAHRVVDLGQ